MNWGVQCPYIAEEEETRFVEFLCTKRRGVVSDSGIVFQVEDHSRNSVSYLKGLRILALESLEALKMHLNT